MKRSITHKQVTDAMLAMFVERNLDRPRKRHFRVTYGDDSLPALPIDSSAVHFLHFGLRLHFDTSYQLKLQVAREMVVPGEAAPGRRSSSSTAAAAGGFVTSRINAARELARGFFFREGWVLLLLRAMAVALPGLPFHRVHDYVTAVALAAHIPKDNSTNN